MYELVVKPRAIKMASDAYNWYEEQQKGLGEAFVQEIERCLNSIEVWPNAYAKVKRNFRQVVLKAFPYVIVFEVIQNVVVIYAVFHTSRNPGKKFKK
jgi:hypothetical protein